MNHELYFSSFLIYLFSTTYNNCDMNIIYTIITSFNSIIVFIITLTVYKKARDMRKIISAFTQLNITFLTI
jgi:multidrug transporter EmrE-like cation transporter